MIIQERYTLNGRDFIRTYSDDGRYVVGGEPQDEYSEANDPADLNRTYVEGDKIPADDSELAEKAAAFDILMGVSE